VTSWWRKMVETPLTLRPGHRIIVRGAAMI
jgi:hypothetical protein